MLNCFKGSIRDILALTYWEVVLFLLIIIKLFLFIIENVEKLRMSRRKASSYSDVDYQRIPSRLSNSDFVDAQVSFH